MYDFCFPPIYDIPKRRSFVTLSPHQWLYLYRLSLWCWRKRPRCCHRKSSHVCNVDYWDHCRRFPTQRDIPSSVDVINLQTVTRFSVLSTLLIGCLRSPRVEYWFIITSHTTDTVFLHYDDPIPSTYLPIALRSVSTHDVLFLCVAIVRSCSDLDMFSAGNTCHLRCLNEMQNFVIKSPHFSLLCMMIIMSSLICCQKSGYKYNQNQFRSMSLSSNKFFIQVFFV